MTALKRTAPALPAETPVFDQARKAYRLAECRDKITEIFRYYDVSMYLAIFDQMHAHVNQDTYHNKDHAYITALNSLEGAIWAGLDNTDCRAMLVAGLFHDAAHSRGYASDAANICEAMRFFRATHDCVLTHDMCNLTALSGYELRIVKGAIKSTHFENGKYSTRVSSVYNKIIQDADLMLYYIEDKKKVTEMLMGLRNEINVTRDLLWEEPLSISEFIDTQVKFANSRSWHTNWAKLKAVYLNWPHQAKQAVKNLAELQPAELHSL